MKDKIILEVSLWTHDNDEKLRIGNDIHEMLAGHPVYINSNIILNIDRDNVIKLIVYEGCNEIPQITTYEGDSIIAIRFNGKEVITKKEGKSWR